MWSHKDHAELLRVYFYITTLKNNLALHGKGGYAQTVLSSLILPPYLRETPAHLDRKSVKSGNNSIVCMYLKPGYDPKVLK